MEASSLSPRVWPLYLATFLSTYVFAVANISVPGMQAALDLPGSRTTLVIGAYSVSFAAGLIICGRLGDTFGRRRLFRIGIAAIFVCAILTALAPTVELLVLGRLLQGCAAALTTPQILSTIQATLEGRARSRAISGYSIFAGVGTVGGNIFGGTINSLFPEEYGWRAAFMSIAVIAAIAWAGTGYLRESRSPDPEGFDFPGSALVAFALLCLITGLTNAAAVDPLDPFSSPGMIALTVGLLIASAVGFLVLGRHLQNRELSQRPSVLPLHVIIEPGVKIGMVLAALFFLMMSSFMYNFAILTQQGMGWSPLHSGLALLILAVAFVGSSTVATRLLDSIGPKILLIGAGFQALGLGLLAVVSFLGAEPFLLWLQLVGILIGGGQGLMFGPLIAVVMNHVPDRVAGLTGGLIATAQQAGMGIGVATLSSLFTVLLAVFPARTAFGWVLVVAVALSLTFGLIATRLVRPRPQAG
ncbi:MFS transporter [Brevibacterium ihuae]|uniref:MFS transporter n=1 Tax=Brevibacterium ihuae TaxID=1631743 RepID=UPI000C7601E9|nr:MFS transporter [Brevibacterium ihuae]